MTGRVTGIPDPRAAEGDGIEYIPTGETEDLEAAGIGGGSEHQRVLAIDGEWAYAIDSWPGIEGYLVVGGIHHVGVVVVTAGVARQVDLGTIQRDNRVVAVGPRRDRADGLAIAGIKNRVGAIRSIGSVRHVDRGTVRCYGQLIHAERIVGDPCHYVMHEIIGQQAAVAASAIVHVKAVR